MSITIVPFKPEHQLVIHPREERAAKIDLLERLTIGEQRLKVGPCWTMCEDERPVVCAGIIPIMPGTAEMWALVDAKCPHGGLVLMKRRFLAMFKDYALTRIQAVTADCWPGGGRFLEWLGMSKEGVMRKFGPNGADQAIYARVV